MSYRDIAKHLGISNDTLIAHWLKEYRPMVQLLKAKGFLVNHKKSQYLMKNLGCV